MLKKIIPVLKSNLLVISFVLVGLLSVTLGRPSSPPPSETNPNIKSADTFIPRGFVLVPLEIANAESLASLVGDLGGVVDLYLANNGDQKGGLKVGTKLKILRAPLNPQQYAVLVKEHESSQLLSHAGPFIAVVQNPNEKGDIINSPSSQRIKIEYQN